jgi:uncharacterized Fe-S cluster-containing radical SAM superfamily enzyme
LSGVRNRKGVTEMDDTIQGITEKEYREIVTGKLKEGHRYKLWVYISSGEPFKGRFREKVHQKMRVKKFYRHLVELEDEKGYVSCYRYSEIWQMMKGDI